MIATALLVLGAFPAVGAAQGKRDSLRAGIVAHQQGEWDRAIVLLTQGLDPAAGPADSLWIASLYTLADALIQAGKAPLATTWLRWALRHHTPRPLRVDDTNFPPGVLGALAEAASAVATGQGDDSLVPTVWRWPAGPVAANALGGLRLATEEELDLPLRAIVEVAGLLDYGEIPPGEVRFLPPGTYTVTISTGSPETAPLARVTRELLPGVVTELHPRLVGGRETALYVLSEPAAAVLIDGTLVGAAQLTPPGPGERAWVGEKKVQCVWG
jgi:hypothetical protein